MLMQVKTISDYMQNIACDHWITRLNGTIVTVIHPFDNYVTRTFRSWNLALCIILARISRLDPLL